MKALKTKGGFLLFLFYGWLKNCAKSVTMAQSKRAWHSLDGAVEVGRDVPIAPQVKAAFDRWGEVTGLNYLHWWGERTHEPSCKIIFRSKPNQTLAP